MVLCPFSSFFMYDAQTSVHKVARFFRASDRRVRRLLPPALVPAFSAL